MSARANHTIGDRVSILPCTSQRKTVACSCASVFVIARALNLLNRDFFSKRNLRPVLRVSHTRRKAKGSLFSLSLTGASEKNRLIRPLLEGRLEGVNQSL